MASVSCWYCLYFLTGAIILESLIKSTTYIVIFSLFCSLSAKIYFKLHYILCHDFWACFWSSVFWLWWLFLTALRPLAACSVNPWRSFDFVFSKLFTKWPPTKMLQKLTRCQNITFEWKKQSRSPQSLVIATILKSNGHAGFIVFVLFQSLPTQPLSRLTLLLIVCQK